MKKVNKRAETYLDYKRRYYEQRDRMAKKGVSMYDTAILSETEWKSLYKSIENRQLKEIQQGKRDKLSNINNAIINEQTYQFSEKQVAGYRRYLVETGQGFISDANIRVGNFDMRPLYEEQAKLKSQGLTGKEIRIYIGQRFFGSD